MSAGSTSAQTNRIGEQTGFLPHFAHDGVGGRLVRLNISNWSYPETTIGMVDKKDAANLIIDYAGH
jgi:hypothetical protein